MTLSMFFVAAASPYIVAFVRRCTWRKWLVDSVAFGVIVTLVTLGHLFAGTLTLPPTELFLLELAGYFGVQQGSYKFLLRGRPSIEALEAVGNKPAAPPADDVWRPEV